MLAATMPAMEETGKQILVSDTALTGLLLLLSGVGFACGHAIIRRLPSPKKAAATKLLDNDGDGSDMPESKRAEEPSPGAAKPKSDRERRRKHAKGTGEGEPTEREEVEQEAVDEEVVPKTARANAQAAAAAIAAAAAANATFIEALDRVQQRGLAAQVRSISKEAFEEDATQTAKGEKVAMLVLDEEVVGYASYVVRPQLSSFNINKLAVSSARRRQGLGRCLLKHLIQLAKRPAPKTGRGGPARAQPLEVLCLSALPTAITFYKACGFREETTVKLPEDDDEELIEGQVYMEYRLRRKRAK